MSDGPIWRNESDRQILAEIYRSFATKFDSNKNPTVYQEWFRGAGIVEKHPEKGCRTLVVNCNYKPLLMMKEILALAEKYKLALLIQEVDYDGNPKG